MANIDDIKKKWGSILKEVQQQNHSVCAFLKTGQIICIKKDIIELGFPYKFHQDTIKEQKNKKIIEDCISKITGQNLKIEVKHIETSETKQEPVEAIRQSPPEENPSVMNDMLAEFGGEVVE